MCVLRDTKDSHFKSSRNLTTMSTFVSQSRSTFRIHVMVIAAPTQWPKEVSTYYEPIRKLGSGGFGAVVLGKLKKDSTSQEEEDDDDGPNHSGDEKVAIKVVGSRQVTDMDVGYAHREMDILTELSHPSIMRLIRVWEPSRINTPDFSVLHHIEDIYVVFSFIYDTFAHQFQGLSAILIALLSNTHTISALPQALQRIAFPFVQTLSF